MPDVGTQLRDYFDEVVERMTEEDIRVRASTARGVPIGVPRFRVKPTAAVATGFGVAMTLLGGVMVAAKVLGGEPRDAAGNGLPGASTASDPVNSWPLLLLLMAGFGLLAFGMWSMRRSAGDVRERGDENMQTIERPEATAPPGDTKLKDRNRLLTWLVGILAVAVVGLGILLVVDTSGSGADVPSEVLATVDGYVNALNSGTVDEMLAFTTADYEFEAEGYTFTADEMRANFRLAQAQQTRIEIVDRIATGDGPYYVSTSDAAHRGGVIYDGVSTFTIVEENGVWRIARHYYAGPL